MLSYVVEHMDILEDYVADRYPEESFTGHIADLIASPYVARTCIENYETSDAAKWGRIVEKVAYDADGAGVVYTIGRRGARKTMTTCDLVNSVRELTQRRVFGIGLDKMGPPWIDHAYRIADVPHGSIVIVDEASAQANSRRAMTREQSALPEILSTNRHRNLLVFFITQDTASADVTILRKCDHIMVKPMGFAQNSMERGALRGLIGPWVDEFVPLSNEETLFLSGEMNPWFLRRPVPDWWKREFSMAYGKLSRARAETIAMQLHLGGHTFPSIADKLRTRGQDLTGKRWSQIIRTKCECEPCLELKEASA